MTTRTHGVGRASELAKGAGPADKWKLIEGKARGTERTMNGELERERSVRGWCEY